MDYSGKRIGIADPTKGEIREAEIFDEEGPPPAQQRGELGVVEIGGFGVKRLMDLPTAWSDQWSALGS